VTSQYSSQSTTHSNPDRISENRASAHLHINRQAVIYNREHSHGFYISRERSHSEPLGWRFPIANRPVSVITQPQRTDSYWPHIVYATITMLLFIPLGLVGWISAGESNIVKSNVHTLCSVVVMGSNVSQECQPLLRMTATEPRMSC